MGLVLHIEFRRSHTNHKAPCHNSRLYEARFGIEFGPLRSPLTEGITVVSFPPLSNMLKFGG